MQFLMGLNDTYDPTKNQILLLDSLPHIDKVYSMVMNTERQRQVTSIFAEGMDVTTLIISSNAQRYTCSGRNGFKKKELTKKEDKFCNYCKENGHSKETCFKLHDYPDWYKELRQKKRGFAGYKTRVNVAETPFDDEEIGDNFKRHERSEIKTSMREVIQEEISKVLKGKAAIDHNFVGYTHEFVSTIPNIAPKETCWIIDTSASNHICAEISLFNKLDKIKKQNSVHLANDTVLRVEYFADIVLKSDLNLKGVLYIPLFHHNLLSVSKLAKNNSVTFTFFPDFCLLQDRKTKETIAVSKSSSNLYCL